MNAQVFVVVTGGGYWGKGKTLQEAAQQAKKEGSRNSDTVVAYAYVGTEEVLKGIGVDSYGGINYPATGVESIRLFGPADSTIKLGNLVKGVAK